jgi:uncharacterized protein (DUF1330 family)
LRWLAVFRDNSLTLGRTTAVPAYIIFLRESAVRDTAAFETYRSSNRDGPRDPNLKPLVVYGALEALEGEAPDGVVMLQFPTVADARAWYGSPGYQAAIPHRQRAADYRAFIVEGL